MTEVGGHPGGHGASASPTRRRWLRTAFGAVAARPFAGARAAAVPAGEPFTVGAFRHVYSAGPRRPDGSPPPGWHLNDHAFVRGPDGLWHLFGIAWPDPGVTPVPRLGFLEHATSPAPAGPAARWERRAPVLELDPARGETVIWAPHVVRHRGVYHLFVATGGPDLTRWGITLATSTDLNAWARVGPGPLFRDGFQARDPMVLHLPDENLWALYYTATERPEGGRHVVAYRTSPDLTHWGDRQVAYRDVHEGTDFGPTESPFVVRRGRRFYLFVGPRPYDRPTPDLPNFRHPGYVGTDVFASDDWRRWADAGRVGHVAAHAPELVEDGDGSWWVSSAGVARGGLDLAPFRWLDS